ncbi:MAG: MATE family efflux transporter [Clostridiales bacterium]|nr:MATE family efflux transporter [Clostridiales bacterium]
MKSKNVDMINGPLMKKMIAYTIPVILTGLLQLFYNAADLVVIGQFADERAFAAVGATPSLNAMFVTFFIGLSIGGCICVGQYYGARDAKNVTEAVHTGILISIIFGVAVSVAGILFVEDLLRAMGTHEDIIGLAALYLKIVMTFFPFTLFYNFAAGILKAAGDTKRPFYILVFSGLVNVCLNLVFVLAFHMTVEGVALATGIGSVINALLGGILLFKTDDMIKVSLKNLKISKDKMKMIFANGIPLGVQSLVFSASNVLIQASVNSFSSIAVVAGNSAASNIEGFVYTAMNSTANTVLNFTAQNYGAKKYDRINKILGYGTALVLIVWALVGGSAVIFGEHLLKIYQPNNLEAVKYGLIRNSIIGSTYFLCGIMDTVSYVFKGAGKTFLSMLIAVFSIVGIRVAWILTVFRKYHTLQMLYVSWPITWIGAIIAFYTLYFIQKRKYNKLKANKMIT